LLVHPRLRGRLDLATRVCAFVRGVCAFVRGVCMLCVCMRPSVCGALRCEGTSSCRSRWRRCTRRPSHARRAAAAVACPPCRCSSTSSSTVHVFCYDAIFATNRIFAKTGSGQTTGKVERRPFLSAGATLYLFVARWVSSRNLLPPPPPLIPPSPPPPCSFLATVSCGSS
jgi:hypothetical protein